MREMIMLAATLGGFSVAFVMARQLMRFIRSGKEERKTKIIWLSKGFQAVLTGKNNSH